MLIVIPLLGCGPNVAEDAIELEEACGAEGPVHLLAVDPPGDRDGGLYWGSAVIGDRRVAAWYDASPGSYADSFGAFVLDACGGNEVALGEREFPLVIGDAAFVCDPETGEVRPLDLDTAESGDVLGSGYDCSAWIRQGSVLFLRNWDTSRWGMLRPDGLLPLDVPLDPSFEVFHETQLAPYLSSWGWISFALDQQDGRYTHWDQRTIVDKETGQVRFVPDDVRFSFGVEDGRDIFVVHEPDPDGLSRTATLTDLDAPPEPGPTLAGVEGSLWAPPGTSPALLTTESIFLVEQRRSIPRSPLIETMDGLYRANETHVYQQTGEHLRVWDLEDGRLTVDFAAPGFVCNGMAVEGHTLQGSFGDTVDCLDETYWSVPMDGSPPHVLVETGGSTWFFRFAGRDPMALLAPNGSDPHDLQWVDLDTDHRVTVARDVAGLVFPPNTALPRTAPGSTSVVEYYVHRGEDAGLWLVGAPL